MSFNENGKHAAKIFNYKLTPLSAPLIDYLFSSALTDFFALQDED